MASLFLRVFALNPFLPGKPLTLQIALPKLLARIFTFQSHMTTATASKGLEGVVAARTSLSDVKGDIGQLVYCGYDINELAGKVSFEEVIFLLHYNHLPNKQELADLKTHLIA
ncbi:MAG: hypothetical protein M3Y82_15355, partial [Verrucomicrobiota bacterium]|nr:hypothetical protein [Verrucomicrobiota bacterium]